MRKSVLSILLLACTCAQWLVRSAHLVVLGSNLARTPGSYVAHAWSGIVSVRREPWRSGIEYVPDKGNRREDKVSIPGAQVDEVSISWWTAIFTTVKAVSIPGGRDTRVSIPGGRDTQVSNTWCTGNEIPGALLSRGYVRASWKYPPRLLINVNLSTDSC